MGTQYQIQWQAVSPGTQSSAVQNSVAQRLDVLEQIFSTYRADSEISRLNQLAVGESHALSAEMLDVLQAASQVYQQSNGAFDITVGPLVELWGFGPNWTPEPSLPQEQAIATQLANTGMQALEIDKESERLQKRAPRQLDASALAKGYAVDQIADWLNAQGVRNFLVEIGGELRGQGQNRQGEAWRIGVETPNLQRGQAHRLLALDGQAVATSGDYRNFYELAGQRYSHTIDPRSGAPVRHTLASVTVVHDSAMLADAWATAFSVLGEAAPPLADKLGLAAYFLFRDTGDPAVLSERASTAFQVYNINQ